MSEVRPFPGHGCRYFSQGRCLYEEALNPGYDRSLKCRIILEVERGYDHFLVQAEAFGVEDRQAGELWEQRFGRILAQGDICPDFVPGFDNEAGGVDEAGGADEGFPDCALRQDLVCLKAMPRCPGTCARFRPQGG